MGGISLKLSCQRQKMNSENEVMMEGTQYSTPQPPVLIRMFTILRSCNFLFNIFFYSSRFFGWGPPPDFKKNATCLYGRNKRARQISLLFFAVLQQLFNCTIVFYIDNLHKKPIKQDKNVHFNHLFILVTWRYTRAAFKIVACT